MVDRGDGMTRDQGELIAARCAGCNAPMIFLRPSPVCDLRRSLCPFCAQAECRMIVNSVVFRLVTALLASGRPRLAAAIERLIADLRQYEV